MCCKSSKWICAILVSTIIVLIKCQSDKTPTSESASASANDDCNLVINEINIESPGIVKTKDFIELKMVCANQRKSDSLQGFKILGISAGPDSTNSQTMTVDLIINLWNQKIKNKDFFTIGSTNVVNVDMQPNSPYFAYRSKFTGNTQSMFSFLNKGNNYIHALAIIYKKNYGFPEFVLTQKQVFLNIDSNLQEIIRENLVDLVVYTKKSSFDNCKLFTTLHQDYANKLYILREFDNSKKDRTLNRCSLDGKSFTPEKFKLGSPTPGADNDCTGPHFFIETILPEIMNPTQSKPFDSDNMEEIDFTLEQSESPKCTASFDASMYASISDDEIEERIQQETEIATRSSCTALNLGANSGNIADEVDRIRESKRRWSETSVDEEDLGWKNANQFQ